MHLNGMADDLHATAVSKGFWDHLQIRLEPDGPSDVLVNNPSIWPEKIALIHSEASEMLDALRDGREDLLGEECADLFIRLLDFTAARGIDLEYHIDRKAAKNKLRDHLHGRQF
jgi:MazG nucleotide pyrophosphohydrolase domain